MYAHRQVNEPSDPAPDRRPRWLLPAAAAACLVYLAAELFLVGRLGFPLDDSWIHLQFAKHLAAGNGLSYSAGERVTGSTAPLWTALLTPPRKPHYPRGCGA